MAEAANALGEDGGVLHLLVSGLGHEGLDVELGGGAEPGAVEVGGALLVVEAALHDEDALVVGGEGDVAVGGRGAVERAAEVVDHADELFHESLRVHGYLHGAAALGAGLTCP